MSVKTLFFITLIACTGHVAIAQKYFTIAEATNGMTTTLAPKSLKQAVWEPGTHRLYYVVKTGSGDTWVATDFPKGSVDTVFKLKELNKEAFGTDRLKQIPEMTWIDKDLVAFQDDYDIKEGLRVNNRFVWNGQTKLQQDAANITRGKNGIIAYTVGNNLWMYRKDKGNVALTNDVDSNIISGQSVHRNEFGIEKGIFISPEGNYIAYYRMDQHMVADYPIINWLVTPATVRMDKYPMAGGTSHQVTLRVYNPATSKTTEIITEGEKDQYLTAVSWSPDERYIYIALLNRGQNNMQLNKYDIHSGKKVATILQETSRKYVEPQHPLSFLPGSNDKFIWWSQRDGYMHLYLYHTNGKLIKQLTKGKWVVNELIGFNPSENEVIITASKESPLEKHAYAVNYNNGHIRRINEEPGVHTITLSDDGKYMLDVYSAAGIPKRTVVRATTGNYKQVLIDAANTLAAYTRPEIQNITLSASDGTPLYGKLILPVNFDKNKKYPVIVYLYNGPHIQLIKNNFPESNNLWYEYMAQRGYVVFSMDGRGSSNRGRDFEQATFRMLGTVEMQDQMKGIEYLKSLPYVDASRMGMHGWSFGGFMTTSFMLKYPDIFKCAVAGGPVMDWSMYEVMYTERYMDTPEENPEGYANANLLTKVKNLKGKLLLIHGTDDNTVVWQHSIKFLQNAVKEGIQVDYFVYPGYEHNVRGKDRVHLMQKVSDYFDLYLKP